MGFAENLQAIRKENHLSQEELAEILDVSRQAVSKWEQGTGYPEVEKLLLLSSKLDVSLDLLFSAGEFTADAAAENSVETEAATVPRGRVTIQDIANALGLSRNTVSKALNNTGVISAATRMRVLTKASEMGYKQFYFETIGNIRTKNAPTITYQEFGAERIDEIMRIYEQQEWDLYQNTPRKVARAFSRSLLCLGAFDDDRLIGFIRCTGDGEYVVNIEDLIVDKTFRRQHIGQTLLQKVVGRFPDLDMITLVATINHEGLRGFFLSCGFVPYEQKELIGFVRQVRQ